MTHLNTTNATINTEGELAKGRNLAAGSGIALTDGGAGNSLTIALKLDILNTDPASPGEGEPWVLRSVVAESGTPMGLLLLLTKCLYSYELSIYVDGSPRRTTLS